MFSRIRWRIAVPNMLLIGLAMLGLTAYILGVGRANYLENLKERLAAEAGLVAEVMRDPLAEGDHSALRNRAGRYAEVLNARVTVISKGGQVLADSAQNPDIMDSHWYRPEVQQAITVGSGSSVRFSDTVRFEMIYVATAVRSEGELVGVLRVAVPLSRLDATMQRLWSDSRWGIGLSALLALALAVLIAETTVRPVRSLTGVVHRMAEGDLDAQLLPSTRDEIGDLTESFNEMASRLRQTVTDLDQERAQLAAVLDNMADGALIVDADGQVALINPAAERILEVAPGEALHHSIPQVVRQHEIIGIWEACRSQRREQVELVEVEREGLFLQVVATPLGGEEGDQFLLIFQDLHHVRQLETIRREFVSNVSHELRTPLASLKALSETLIDGGIDDRERALGFVARIDAEVDVLTQMTQELSELTRIESGQAPMRLSPVSVETAIRSAVQRLGPQAERSGLAIHVQTPADLPLVLGDLERLRQVATNLLHNAIKFTPEGGEIHISAEATVDEVMVSVRDTGVGISEEALPRIFERFYKRDRSRSGEGMGLGLAIAKHVVQGHGGVIWAESVEGKGSTFRFTLLRADRSGHASESL